MDEIEQKKEKALNEIREAHGRLVKHFDAGQLVETEQEVYNVIRPVLSKPVMLATYANLEDVKQEALSALYYLGRIYLSGGNQDLYPYVKAAAIFQYCAKFSEKYDVTFALPQNHQADKNFFLSKSLLFEKKFLENLDKTINKNFLSQAKQKINQYKEELDDVREMTKGELLSIEHLKLEQIAKRANGVEEIYKNSCNFFINENNNGLVQRLLNDCYEQLGLPPCEYSILGLGSLAVGSMTPWSDLEFAVLIDQDKPEYKEYFRNLTKLLWIKVINFGETPLSAVGIRCLNNYASGKEADDWFADDVIEKAFRFDPVYEDACKSPLGRQGQYRVKKKIKNEETGIDEEITEYKPEYELILTKEEMLSFQEEIAQEISEQEQYGEAQSWFDTDRHLWQAVQNFCLIDGSQTLLDEYRADLIFFKHKNNELSKTRSMDILKEDVDKFRLKLGDEEEGKLLDAKKTIYRLGDRVVNALANYYDISADAKESYISVWQMIEKMRENSLLSEEGAQHLREAISISTELRIRTYSANEGRYDTMSTYMPAVDHLDERQRKVLVEKTFKIKDLDILYHFYYVMLEVQNVSKTFCIERDYESTSFFHIDLFDNDNHTKGLIHARFLQYDKALEFLDKAKQEVPNNIYILNDLYFLCSKTKDIEMQFKIAEEMLTFNEEKYSNDTNHPDIAYIYNNLGLIYSAKGSYDESIKNYKKALSIYSECYKSNTSHPDIISIYNDLGGIYYCKGYYKEAVEEYENILKIISKTDSSFYFQFTPNLYNNLIRACVSAKEVKKALKYTLEFGNKSLTELPFLQSINTESDIQKKKHQEVSEENIRVINESDPDEMFLYISDSELQEIELSGEETI